MSTGGPNTQRFSPFTPPLRGSFPLDREHKCDSIVKEYLACIKSYNLNKKDRDSVTDESSSSSVCRDLARRYFDCRMKAGLMTKEDLGNLGFGGVDNVVDDGQQAGHHVSEDQVDKEFLGKESILRELEQELQRRQDGLMS